MSKETIFVDSALDKCVASSVPTTDLLSNTHWENLTGATTIFHKSLELGRVRGLIWIFDFPGTKDEDDSSILQLIRELITHDILVATCTNSTAATLKEEIMGTDFFQHTGDGLAEFCDFVGIPPVLSPISAANTSGVLSFYNELAQLAGLSEADLPTAVIAPPQHHGYIENIGEQFHIQQEPAQTAELVDHYIHSKRIKAQWCDRCGGRFSPFS